jgi:hypothetical protein
MILKHNSFGKNPSASSTIMCMYGKYNLEFYCKMDLMFSIYVFSKLDLYFDFKMLCLIFNTLCMKAELCTCPGNKRKTFNKWILGNDS